MHNSLPVLIAAMVFAAAVNCPLAAAAFAPDSAQVMACIQKFEAAMPADRVSAMEQVVAAGGIAAPLLGAALHYGGEQTRVMAAIALCRLQQYALPAIQAIIAGMQDSSVVVRMHCAWALRYFPDAASLFELPLRAAARDSDASVRRAAVLSLSMVSPAFLAETPSDNAVIAKADSLIPVLQSRYNVPGVQVVVLRRHAVLWSKTYGIADASTGAPVTEATMFEACSMTKPVFAYLALLLMRERSIDLDSPVCRLYDDPAFMGQPQRLEITPRMLLAHTSGLPNWRPGDEDNEGLLPVLFKPGLKFSYSGEGMFLLQRALEKVTGTSFEHTANNRLFAPLGMHHSSMVYTPAYEKYIAAGHNEVGEFRKKTAYGRANAGFTLYCSASDYAKFLLFLMRPASKSTVTNSGAIVRQMLTPQVVTPTREPVRRPGRATGFDAWMGLGIGINTTAGTPIYSHSGANESGFRCYSQFNPEEGSGIVIMTNALSGTLLWESIIAEMGDL